jgi:uncharacterized protein YcgI (DUF1989 family)
VNAESGRPEEDEMAATLVEEIVVPKCEGRAFTVDEGQVMRVVAVEGAQAADIVAFNAEDYRESLCTWLTRHMSGSFVHADTVYTKLPAGRAMFTVEHAPPGVFWLSPGRCNRLKYDRLGRPGHPNCQDILTDTIRPYGLSGFDVPDVLNVFMNAQFRTDGTYEFTASPVEPGDYVALRAELRTLVAVSACPDDAAYNLGYPKPLKIELWR